MYSVLYDLLWRVVLLLGRLLAFANLRLREWFVVRTGWAKDLETINPSKKPVFWMHVSSLGEFEQGRPVLDQFREQYPDWFIVLSFFSTSGYKMRNRYPAADYVCYLPADTKVNAEAFLQLVEPQLAVFVKYDFWFHFLSALKSRKTPTLLISAAFRPGQPFFQWYGGFWREMLTCFTRIFTQDQESTELLNTIGICTAQTSGDTRVDRVLQLASGLQEQPLGKLPFRAGRKIFIAGSIWKPDAEILEKYIRIHPQAAWIIAPHDPSTDFVAWLEAYLPGKKVKLSQFLSQTMEMESECDILIVDTIGHLNKLYAYGSIAYIGGGFGAGIHNTLEPAAFGLPILFGPNYAKFKEACLMVERGGAFAVGDKKTLIEKLEQLEQPDFNRQAVSVVSAYMQDNQGATRQIRDYIELFVPKK